ncbi:hypothetical protein BU15DRAFT_71800 [Melanogaster broomeanus]|nr:hypothetical protein BU15DRAFT_71800 [Melanogaster broomeanus]
MFMRHIRLSATPASSEQYIHPPGTYSSCRAVRKRHNHPLTLRIHFPPHPRNENPANPAPPSTPAPDLPPSKLEEELQIEAYGAWLGFNASSLHTLRMSKQDLVDEANKYAWNVLGWADKMTTTQFGKRNVQILSLERVTGLNTTVEYREVKQSSHFDRGEGHSSSVEVILDVTAP